MRRPSVEGSPADAPPPLPPPDEERPATVADVKSLRRWVIVAGVWAVAATALAVIALLKPSGDKDAESAVAANRSIGRLQQRIDDRFRQLDDRVGRLPQSSELQKLEDRVSKVEDDASGTAKDAKAARSSIGDLQDRVAKVERAQKDQSSTTGGATAGGSTPNSSGGKPQK